MSQPPAVHANPGNAANVVYILYLVSIVAGVTGLIGVIIAYVNKGEAPDWVASHYRYQIRTFWIGLLILIIGGILTLILVGWLVLLAWLIWLIVRCAKGMNHLGQGRPIPEDG